MAKPIKSVRSYLNMKRINFSVGILHNEKHEFQEYARAINKAFPEEDRVEVKSENDNPYGYYMINCTGNWNTYEALMTLPCLKSIEHFED